MGRHGNCNSGYNSNNGYNNNNGYNRPTYSNNNGYRPNRPSSIGGVIGGVLGGILNGGNNGYNNNGGYNNGRPQSRPRVGDKSSSPTLIIDPASEFGVPSTKSSSSTKGGINFGQ